MKKILFITYDLPIGGIESALLSLLKRLPSSKYDITLLLMANHGERVEEIPPQIRVQVLPVNQAIFVWGGEWIRKYKPYKKYPVRSACRILLCGIGRIFPNWDLWPIRQAFIKPIQEEYDIAIDYSGALLGILKDKVKAKRKLAWNHFTYSRVGNAERDYSYYRELDGIVSVLEKGMKDMKETFPSISNKMKYVPNLIDSDYINRMAKQIPNIFYSNDRNLRLCTVGRLEKEKDFPLALKSACLLKESGEFFEWFILGEGSERPKIELLIEKYELQNYVILLGQCRNPYPYIKEADMYVQTSEHEGKSIAVAEAQVLCKPIIVTAINGLQEYTGDGKYGYAVPRNAESVATAILKLKNDYKARTRIEQELATKDWGQSTILDIFESVVNGEE